MEGRPATMAEARRLFRVMTVAHELLDELHARPLDDAGRRRLARLFDLVLADAEDVLPVPLRGELAGLARCVDETSVTDGELRIALAELVGWLDGTVASTPFMVAAEPPPDGSA